MILSEFYFQVRFFKKAIIPVSKEEIKVSKYRDAEVTHV